MKLFVKNMVCDRCILMVKQSLDKLFIDYNTVELGEIGTDKPISDDQFISLKNLLLLLGFELLDDRKSSIIIQIKSCIIKYIHSDDEAVMNRKLSVMLSEKLETDYIFPHYFHQLKGLP